MSRLLRLATLAVAATAVAAILFAAGVLPSSRAISLGIVLLVAIAFVELFLAVRVADESGARATLLFEEALRPQQAAHRRPTELERMEREIVLGSAAAVWARHRLLPRLRTAATARLSARHGIDFDRNPRAARELLGEDAWEMLRPDLPEPADSTIPGIPREQIAALLTRLESV